jgi:hypothetical protein
MEWKKVAQIPLLDFPENAKKQIRFLPMVLQSHARPGTECTLDLFLALS